MKDWWRTVALEHQLESHHYFLLEVACGAWDAMEAARKEIAKEGTSSSTRKASRGHARKELELDPPPKKIGGIGWLGPDQ
jgi:hypothetical protein